MNLGSDYTGDDDQYDAEREDSDDDTGNRSNSNRNTRAKWVFAMYWFNLNFFAYQCFLCSIIDWMHTRTQ